MSLKEGCFALCDETPFHVFSYNTDISKGRLTKECLKDSITVIDKKYKDKKWWHWLVVYIHGLTICVSTLWVFLLCTPYIENRVALINDIDQDEDTDVEDIKVDAEKKSRRKTNKLNEL